MTKERHVLAPLTDISILELYRMRGGVIYSSTTAIKIAKALIEGLYSQSQVDKDEPFSAIEETDRWIVTGSAKNPTHATRVVLSKYDASIMDLYVTQPFPPRE